MKWKVISFYTPDYRDVVSTLIKSLEKFEIPYDIECVKSKGTWKQNTFYKIPFILKKLKEYNHPLVWLDADAEVVQYPTLFNKLEPILMAGIYTALEKPEFTANTMYFAPDEDVYVFLKGVIKFIKDVPDAYGKELVGDQLYVRAVLESNDWKERLKFKVLPFSYALPVYWKRAKHYKRYTTLPVIIQHQASRFKDPIRNTLYKRKGLIR